MEQVKDIPAVARNQRFFFKAWKIPNRALEHKTYTFLTNKTHLENILCTLPSFPVVYTTLGSAVQDFCYLEMRLCEVIFLQLDAKLPLMIEIVFCWLGAFWRQLLTA